MKRFYLYAAVLVILLVGWFVVSRSSESLKQHQASKESAPALNAVVASVQGTVSMTSGTSTHQAVQGELVHAGDSFLTGSDGTVSIEFFSGARTALAPNTSLTISAASIDPDNAKQTQVQLELEFGRVWSRVLKLLDADSGYAIEYNGVISSVRGTAFALRGQDIFKANTLSIDQFDGTVELSGKTSGNLTPGFSVIFDTIAPPTSVKDLISFTPDEVRDDRWIREQLKADEEFARRAERIRASFGIKENIDKIGHEAGPFTMNEPGAQHSNFQTVEVRTVNPLPNQTLIVGNRIELKAFALFQDILRPRAQDVTPEAIWQISNQSIAELEQTRTGMFLKAKTPGTIRVLARWNDGTHEHSGAATFTISSPTSSAPIINNKIILQIQPTR